MRKKALCGSAILAIMFLYPLVSSDAETIVLKSDEKIKGTVIEKNDKYVKVDYKGAVIVYRASEIESIDGKPLMAGSGAGSEKPLNFLLESQPSSKGLADSGVVTAEEYLARGIEYYNKGNFDQAMSDFNKAIKLKAAYTRAYMYRGLAYVAKNDLDKAIDDYNKALTLEPKNEEAYYIRGIAYSGKKDIDKAIADYNKAIELNPQYVQAYLNRGFIYIVKGKPEQVLADVNEVMKINPKVPIAYFLRGLVYSNSNNLEQGISDYSKAIELNPNYIEAYFNRALAYAYREKVEQAKIDPNSPRAYINTGFNDINKDDLDKAIADCNRAIELNSKIPDSYMIRARIYLLGKNYDKAWEDVHKVEELGATIRPEFLAELKSTSGRDK